MLLTANAAKSGAQPKRLFPDTEELFRVAIRNEARQFVTMAEVFSLAAEFRTLVYRNEEEKKMVLELRNQMVREERFPTKPTSVTLNLFKQTPSLKSSEGNEKALVLVFIHLHRWHDRLNEELMDDLEYMLSRSPIILRAMVNHARVTCNLNVLSVAIFFQQHLNQALMPSGTLLLQFPHVPADDVEFLTRTAMTKLKIEPKTEKRTRTLLQELFVNYKEKKIPILDDPKHQQDFNRVLQQMPFKDLKIEYGTVKEIKSNKTSKTKTVRDNEYTFEKECYQGDFIHVVVDLVEQNVHRKAASKTAIAHTPFMPHDVKEEWYVIVCGGPNPRGFNQVVSGDNKVASFSVVEDDYHSRLCVDMTFLTINNANDWIGSADWPAGSSNLIVLAFPSAYVDNQKMSPLELKLQDRSKMPRFTHHEEDERLDSEPTSLYAMLQAQTEPEIDSDFEEDTGKKAKGGKEDPDEEGDADGDIE
jgi:hypothetical protein